MAAMDEFDNLVKGLSDKERDTLKEYILQARENLLAARSEEARIRVAEEFITDVHDRLRSPRR